MRLFLPFTSLAWFDGLLVVGGGLLLFLGLLGAIARTVPRVINGPHEETLVGAKFAMLEPLLGLALFYALGEAALHHHAVSAAMETEIGTLRSLSWSIDTLEPDQTGPVHLAYDAYIGALVRVEFPAMAHGNESLAGFSTLNRLATVAEAAPHTEATEAPRAEVRNLIRRAGEFRDKRLARALVRTPGLIVATATSLVLLVFLFFWFLDSGGSWARLLLALMLCASILAVYFCVMVLYGLFLDEADLVPEALSALRLKV